MNQTGRRSESSAAPFTIRYSPESGYKASKGQRLDMKLEIIPNNGFSGPVDVKLRVKVPDPAVGIFTIYDQVIDLGRCSHPYSPLCYTQDLDPDNPPEGYEFVKKAYSAAKRMNIESIDVQIHVKASGGGFVCEERPQYKVSF